MPAIVNFNNRQIIEPGAYSQIKGGVTIPAVLGSSGNVALIDTGSGNGFGWGSGINGEIQNGPKSVYAFDSSVDMKKAMRGGLLYDLTDYLWAPSSNGNGPNRVYYVRAATTTAAKKTLNFGTTLITSPEVLALIPAIIIAALPIDSTVVETRVDGILIASYTKIASDSSLSILYASIAASINLNSLTHKYVASSSASGVVLTGQSGNPAGTNGKIVQITVISSTPVSTQSTFAGGVNIIYASQQSNLIIKAKSEGIGANGVVNSGILTRGYGVRLKAGLVNPNAIILEFFEGQYRGADKQGIDYEIAERNVSNYVICRSAEFKNTTELVNWMQSDYQFNTFFSLDGAFIANANLLSSSVEILDKTTSILIFTNGTTAYNALDVDDVLSSIEDLDNSLFLADDYGSIPNPALGDVERLSGANKGAMSVANTKILSYIENSSTFTEKALYIGGGNDISKFNVTSGTQDGSIQMAKYYDNSLAIIIHSGVKVPNAGVVNGNAFKFLPTIYHAAMVCGRNAGLAPQTPSTYKDLRIVGLVHEMKKSERELALLSGVLHNKFVPDLGWVINQGVNTLQKNSSLVDVNGKSPEIQVMRIIHQINKELVINGTPRFVGGNLNTSSAEDVKLFVEGYLTDRTASRLNDNLLITFQKVKVVLNQDRWEVTYCFVPNSPINRTFFTGFILDPKIEL